MSYEIQQSDCIFFNPEFSVMYNKCEQYFLCLLSSSAYVVAIS